MSTLLLIYFFTLSVSVHLLPAVSLESTDRDTLIQSQYERFVQEYFETGKPEALLFIYLLLKEEDSSYPLFYKSISPYKEQDLDFYHCVRESDSAEGFALCTKNTDLQLFVVFEHTKSGLNTKPLLESIREREKTPRQKLFLTHLSEDTLPDSFFSQRLPDLLDIAIITHGFRRSSLHPGYTSFFSQWHKTIQSYSKDSLFNYSDRILLLYATILGSKIKHDNETIVQLADYFIGHADQIPLTLISTLTVFTVSDAAHIRGYFKKAVVFSREVVLPFSYHRSHSSYLLSAINFSAFLSRFGNVQEAIELLEYVYQHRSELDEQRHLPYLINNLATVYYDAGFFEKHTQLIHEALNLAEKYDKINLKTDLLNGLSIHYLSLGNHDLSQKYFEQLQQIEPESLNNSVISSNYSNMGYHHYLVHNDHKSSRKYYLKALDYARASGDYSLIQQSKGLLFYINRDTGQFEEARDINSAILALAEERSDNVYKKIGLINKAGLFFETEAYSDGQSIVRHLLTDEAMRNTKLTYEGYLIQVIAQSYIYQNRKNDAIHEMEQFLYSRTEYLKHSSEIQSGYFYQLTTPDKHIVRLLLDSYIIQGEPERALYWMDKIKNLTSAVFFNNPALRSQVLSESELLMDFGLRNRIDRIRGQLLDAGPSESLELRNQLQQSISQQNTLRRKVLQYYEEDPFDIDTIRRHLNTTDAVFYYTIFDQTIYFATLTKRDVSIETIPVCEESLDRIEHISRSFLEYQVSLLDLDWFRSKVLPSIDWLDSFDNLYVIPDGFLYQIPIETLPISNINGAYRYGEASYMIERVSVSYANSLKDLERAFTSTPTTQHDIDFTGFGISSFDRVSSQLDRERSLPPLPLAEREVKDIADRLTRFESVRIHTSGDGTELNFRRKASRSKILHIASHSEVFESDPLYSLIYLTPGDNAHGTRDDGYIHAYELFSMNLSNEMVMLNSCESGTGSYLLGSGILGLSRAFNHAGVQSLVMNLWMIKDRTAYELSTTFYSYINEGMTKSKSMQQAKIDFMNHRNSNPSYWGSFVIYGNNAPLMSSGTGFFSHGAFKTGLLILALMILGIVFSSKKARRRKK
ncbi:CHAT domain-containing protein [Balneolaceae bacterium ANBcel3]|nr:CHAT domain-containing protein [Balneolaceae bacterium ANBcel3]